MLFCDHETQKMEKEKKLAPQIPPYLNFLIPQIPTKSDPILVNPMKMQPHYGQSSRENMTHPAAHPH